MIDQSRTAEITGWLKFAEHKAREESVNEEFKVETQSHLLYILLSLRALVDLLAFHVGFHFVNQLVVLYTQLQFSERLANNQVKHSGSEHNNGQQTTNELKFTKYRRRISLV